MFELRGLGIYQGDKVTVTEDGHLITIVVNGSMQGFDTLYMYYFNQDFKVVRKAVV